MSNRVEAVIFDWGGTLTPWHDIDHVDQWRHYARAYCQDDSGECEQLARRLAESELRRWRQHDGSGGSDGTGSLDHIFEAEGIDIDSPEHARALTAYLSGWDPHTLAEPDAVPTLTSLREMGMSIGVLSNTLWPRWHHESVFARDGLLDLIDAGVYSSEIPWAKPHASAFATALEALGVESSRAVFVGDRPWDDIHGAQAAGMRAIFIPHSTLGDQTVSVEVTPDAVAVRLLDIVGIVRAWNG